MLKHVPSTLVLAVVCLVFADWPSVQVWSVMTAAHHFTSHGLYLVAGALVGLQTAWWINQTPAVQRVDETGVSS